MNLFLDSGAYSAQSQGKPINLKDYIAYIKEHRSLINIYANLDVIGNWEASWENQKIMEQQGLFPLPVYHLEDPIHCLYKCLEYEGFALGGMAGASTPARIEFLDKCWEIICDTKDNLPKSKVHGFGMSSPKLMRRYPWFSVDSSSWVQYGLHGMLLVPRSTVNQGVYNYGESPVKVFVSTRSPHKSTEGRHFESMSPNEQHWILQYLSNKGFDLGESKLFSVEDNYSLQENESFINKEKTEVERILSPGVSNNGILRDKINFMYFMDLAETRPTWPWPYKPILRRLF